MGTQADRAGRGRSFNQPAVVMTAAFIKANVVDYFKHKSLNGQQSEPRVLHLEDDPRDAELVAAMLSRQWPHCDIEVASDRISFGTALRERAFDLILADFNIPGFGGLEALEMARETCPGTPLIFVSGHMGEDVAAEALKIGATDYLLKHRLDRLNHAARRALNEADELGRRRQAEQALRLSETRFRTLVEQALLGIYVIQGDRFVYVNLAMGKMLGYSIEELTSRPLLDFIAPKDRMMVSENVRKRLQGAVLSVHYVLGMLRRNGDVALVEAHGARVEFNGGPAIMGTLLDITERRQAEEQIREQAALLDKAHDAILVTDLQDRLIFWNKSAERVYGWTSAEVLGKNPYELLFKEQSPQLVEALQAIVRTGEWAGELRQITKDGKNVIVESRWTLVRDVDGRPKSKLVINDDVTEKRKLEGQFLRAQRLESLGTLAGGIAHDLNNVLAPIMMAVQLLRMKSDHSGDTRILDTLETSARRGAEMVRQILSFSRGVENARSELQLKHLIQEQEKIARETFPPSIIIETRVPKDLWKISGDATQLYQVLMNLCVNARDAMPTGGRLVIEVENLIVDEHHARLQVEAKPGPYVILTVSDTGTGISPEIIDKIFDPFFTTKEVGRGTGLGLSTVVSIVKSHGGFVNVYSEVGQGTRFKVYLPSIKVGAHDTTFLHKPNLPVGHGEAILVVDDEIAIREITTQILQNYGYYVVSAKNGEEALVAFGQHRSVIKAAIIDMAMPLMDGPATIRALQRLNPQLKIIAISGMSDNARAAAIAANGTISFLEKPFTTEKLLTFLKAILESTPPVAVPA